MKFQRRNTKNWSKNQWSQIQEMSGENQQNQKSRFLERLPSKREAMRPLY
jgi:hypothetical protein